MKRNSAQASLKKQIKENLGYIVVVLVVLAAVYWLSVLIWTEPAAYESQRYVPPPLEPVSLTMVAEQVVDLGGITLRRHRGRLEQLLDGRWVKVERLP